MYNFAIAAGHNVPLINLINIEDVLEPYTHGVVMAPSTAAVDLFPAEVEVSTGRIVGFGAPRAEWMLPGMKIAGLNHLFDTYLTISSQPVKSAPVTIYTWGPKVGTYQRYNAWLRSPKPRDDYEIKDGWIYNLRLAFTGLERL